MSGLVDPAARVLVRLPSWLGDLVASEPVVRRLDEIVHGPGGSGTLTLAVPARLLEAFEGRFERARRIPLENASSERAADWRGHDVALLLNGSWRSAWTAWRAGIPERIGLTDGGRGAWLTRGVVPARERGAVPLGLGLAGRGRRSLPRPFSAAAAEIAALAGAIVSERAPRLVAAPAAFARVDERLASCGLRGAPFVLVNAGSRAGSAKGYPAELWARLLDAIANQADVPFVLVAAPGEEAPARATAALVQRARVHVLDAPPPPIGELAALSARAALVLAADGGSRHVAQASGAAVVVVCGPTDPRHTAEHRANVRVLSCVVPCGPCHREHCPNPPATELACMRGIETARIAASVLALLPADSRRR